MTRIILQAMHERQDQVDYLMRHIPDLEICWDQDRWAFGTFMAALRLANGEPCIHIEDDIILAKDFRQKVEAAIEERPENLIQFFSMRKADKEAGSRWDRKFAMNQCWYCPAGLGFRFLAHAPAWLADNPKDRSGGYDTMMNDVLRRRKIPYWIHVPSLVQHREGKSLIGPRSSRRQSATFADPQEE